MSLALPETVTLAQIEAAILYQKRRKYYSYFPDEGPLRRELYSKHIEFMDAGSKYRERLFIAGNKIGKTLAGAYETTTHALGIYPAWWKGFQFKSPIDGWIANTNWDTVRDVNQNALIGPPASENEWGTGMIPHSAILDIDKNQHVKNGILIVKVRYRDSKTDYSILQFKNYEQGRESFQGTDKDLVWCDEEIGVDVYGEALLRLMVRRGIMLLTYTPMHGQTALTQQFLAGKIPSRKSIQAGWDDAPHLTKEMKDEMELSIEPHLRGARMKGDPTMGVGMVYPILEERITVPDFEIPSHYVRFGGMDTGWNFTAGVWFCRNNDTGITFIYDVYKESEMPPPMHAEAFKARGPWIPLAGDCADINRMDGEQFLTVYQDLGLHTLELPDKRSKNANIQKIWVALSTGKLKVFKSCAKWFEEFRLYHRDDKGQIVKKQDHIMDATDYGFVSAGPRAIVKPIPRSKHIPETTAWS